MTGKVTYYLRRAHMQTGTALVHSHLAAKTSVRKAQWQDPRAGGAYLWMPTILSFHNTRPIAVSLTTRARASAIAFSSLHNRFR